MSLNASTPGSVSPETASDDRIADVIDRLAAGPATEGQLRAHRVRPAQDATFRSIDLGESVAEALTAWGVDQLYAHQAAAVEAVRDGQNVVLATPTASGKTVTYAVPALERALERDARTLYLVHSGR